MAADGNIHIQPDIGVHDAEGHRIGRSVLIADDLFHIEIIDPLIPARIAAHGKPLSKLTEAVQDPFL